ncbi:MAG: hypothetical protein QF371_03625, partial [Flavobacteriales bacterium]|nr:hypothetical protein [Flavobacteriales bacterium]
LSISTPATSLLVYQTDVTPGFYYYDGTQWQGFGGGGGSDNLGTHTAEQNIELDNNWLSGDGGNEGIMIASNGNVGIGVASPQAGLHTSGIVQMNDLAGSGNRMVIADANGQLSTQAIPTAPGSGSTLYLNMTSDISDLDVAGVSFIHVTTNAQHDIEGLVGGVLNQVIYLINRSSNHDVKFKKEEGTQQFFKDWDLKKEEGGMIMYSGSEWHVISKH